MNHIDLEVKRTPAPDTIELLANTIWGTEGGTRYQHTGTREKIKLLNNPYYLELKLRGKTIGVGNFCQRFFETYAEGMQSYYIRYFSIFDKFKSKNASPKAGKGNGYIKQQVRSIFDKGHFESTNDVQEALFYAYMELENERSVKVCNEFGFIPARQFSTLIFSRLYPKVSKNVVLCESDVDRKEVGKRLKLFYANHSCYESNSLFNNKSTYYLLKQGDEIIAGVQATPILWIIKEMTGISGKLIKKLAPYTPFLSKLFNPNNYRFLAFEQLFYKKGMEHRLNELLESVCALNGYHVGMTWADNKSDLYQNLRYHLKLGLLDKINADVPADIIVKFANTCTEKQAAFLNQPAYISAFDLT